MITWIPSYMVPELIRKGVTIYSEFRFLGISRISYKDEDDSTLRRVQRTLSGQRFIKFPRNRKNWLKNQDDE